MTHKLGVFWAVMHRRAQDYAYMSALLPPVVKIQDGGPNDYAWVRANLPGALVLARDWALGEQKEDMRRAPIETGRRHAQEWNAHAERLGFDRAHTLVLGINEPEVWHDFSCVPYTVAFLDECTRLGLRAGALQLSVGWPANRGPDTPPDWTPFEPVREAIARGGHALVLHEYWAQAGPGEQWGWWAGRALRCPWDVPIVIGECGMDVYVKDGGVPHHRRGWQAWVSADVYGRQVGDYVRRLNSDRRVLGVCPFLTDYANAEWQSFDTEPAASALLTFGKSPSADNPNVYVPIVQVPAGDLFERVMEFVSSWEGAFQANPEDHGNWTGGRKGVGELRGTKYGISAASYPHLDIVNLTRAEANAIYRRDYWQASGANNLAWPACLLMMDTAVLHGVGTAKAWAAATGLNAWRMAAKRLETYTKLDNWPTFGAGWVRRTAALLAAMGEVT